MPGFPRTILLFVDGLGMGSGDNRSCPVRAGVCPCLVELQQTCATPLDAALGVPGLPQSATGQTALLTGVNAAAVMQRHVEGFPGERLREIVRAHNLLARLQRLGLRATFANAYYAPDVEAVRQGRPQSVTTVAALSALGEVRTRELLSANRAVCHDLTRATLRARGYDGPLITPEEAAEHLLSVSAEYDLTLFEHFLTDRAGHSGALDRAEQVLATFDRFLTRLSERAAGQGLSIALCSDHGNIEDMSTPLHTLNPVPFIRTGPLARAPASRLHDLTNVTPFFLELAA